MTSNYLILKKWREVDSFNIIFYSSVTPKAAFQKKKIYNLYYPDFFLFKMYLLFGHNE